MHIENEGKQTFMPKINISLSYEILEEMDRVGREEKLTRSELIRRAFAAYVELLAVQKKEAKKRKAIAGAVKIQDEVRKLLGEADLNKDLRIWREKHR